MASKEQGKAEKFAKIQAAGTGTGAGLNQTDAEEYKKITAEGTASPTKNLVNQTLAEKYHDLSGS